MPQARSSGAFEAPEPHTLPRRFYNRSRPFVRISTVTHCFAVQEFVGLPPIFTSGLGLGKKSRLFINTPGTIVFEAAKQVKELELTRIVMSTPERIVLATEPMREMIDETKDRPRHRELRHLLFSTSMWIL